MVSQAIDIARYFMYWQGMSGIKEGIIFEISLSFLFVSEN
jgi:hypothetical protein